MNRSFLLALLILAAPQFAGCQPTDAPASEASESVTAEAPAVDPATVRAEIEAIQARYQAADRIGDHATIAALYADDAVIHPANKPAARGRAALDAYFAANSSDPEELTFTTVDVGVSDDGSLAYEVGTVAGPKGAGKYLTVYRRTADGWTIVGDTWSQDAPPSAPAP